MADWREAVLSWYPDLHTRTYCLPPVFFKREQYDRVTVAGQSALVCRETPEESTFVSQPAPSAGVLVSPMASSDNQPAHSASPKPAGSPPTKPATSVGGDGQTAVRSEAPHRCAEAFCTLGQALPAGTLPPSQKQEAASPKRTRRRKKKTGTKQDASYNQQGAEASKETQETCRPGVPHDMWTQDSQSGETPPQVYASDLRDHSAQQHVLHNMQALSERLGGARLVLSQLSFTDYLNKHDHAAAAATLPRPVDLEPSLQRGDFDVLVMDGERGMLVCEIKSVGMRETELDRTQAEAETDLIKRLEKAVTQLRKSRKVVQHLVSDLVPDLAVRMTLILPYVSAARLQEVLGANSQLEQAVCQCLGAPDGPSAVRLCLCSEQLSPADSPWHVPESVLNELVTWWDRRMTEIPDPRMTPEVYIDLFARFCGPATSVSVHFVSRPRVEVRTLGQAVWESGERLSRLLLTPDQLHLLHRAPDTVCLAGPPGTGKSVLLVLMGLVWLRKGYDVHVVSSSHVSLTVSHQIHHQLITTLQNDVTVQDDVTAAASSTGRVHFHDFDFLNSPSDVDAAVNTLVTTSASAGTQPLCMLMDEIFTADQRLAPLYQTFVDTLKDRVKRLCLWAATMRALHVPDALQLEPLTTPLRSAPRVVREVATAAGVDKTAGLLSTYTSSRALVLCDGPAVVRLRHEGSGHAGRWPVDCVKCGENVAATLKSLHVGETGQELPSSSPLSYRDVFVLTRSSELHDDVTDDAGRVTSPASGLVRGLRAAGTPVCVMCSVVNIADEAKWRKNAEDTAVARIDCVVVADCRAVVGLERKIVVYLPGRWRGVDDFRSKEGIDAIDRIFSISRCVAQLVVVDVPDDAGGGSASGVEGGGVGEGGGQHCCPPPSPIPLPSALDARTEPKETIVQYESGLWPVMFTTDDL